MPAHRFAESLASGLWCMDSSEKLLLQPLVKTTLVARRLREPFCGSAFVVHSLVCDIREPVLDAPRLIQAL